jgi:hypothetical protein
MEISAAPFTASRDAETQLAGMLKQMLGEIGRTWSSEGSWRRRHVINAGSFIFVPIIEWKSRACILMPSSDDKSVVLS